MGSFVEFINDCSKMFVDSTGLMLIQSSVLIAILFGLDLLLRKRIRAVFRYSLWMLVLIKLVLPSNLSMPFSMGYWLGNVFDRVESSLPDASNPRHTPTLVANESSSDSAEIIFDDSAQQILATPEDTDTLLTPNLLQNKYSAEAPATNDYVRASVVKTKLATDNMAVPPPREADLARDRAVALTWQAALFGLWLVGCMTTSLLVLQRTLLMQRLVRQALPANNRLVGLFESCRKRMLIGRDVGLRVSSVIPAPAVYGLFRPIVLIPKNMICSKLGSEELEAIFTHELVHIQRCDLWVKLLQTILQVVYFYNPLLWLVNATIRRVRELAVDEAVLVILGRSTSEVYPRTLLKVAGWALDQPKHGLRLIGVMESNDLLTERINIMLHKPMPHSKKVGMIGLITLFMLGVFLLPMARAGAIQKAPEEVAPSKTENVKDAKEIEAIKASIDSLQLAIQMKLDELHEKQAELELLREALNVKINGRGGSATTPDATEHVFAAVKPSDVGYYGGQSGQSNRRPKGVGMLGALSMPPGPGAKTSATSGWTVRTPGSQPTGGRVPAALSMPPGPGVGTSATSSSSARTPGSDPTGGRVPAVFSMPPRLGGGTSATSSSSARTPGSEPMGGRVPAALSMMPGGGVGQGSMLAEGALAKDISDEVRKELQRLLPGLLREMLPRLIEAEIRAAENTIAAEEPH
ncbi:MAG: M56 family metallopeptidase [Phycisphaerae bacterium]|nr:M56 family metallopeptidase [Phycisphaerae bacterium]